MTEKNGRLRKKTGTFVNNGTGVGVIIPSEWAKELNIKKNARVEKILFNELIILSPKKLSDHKVIERIKDMEKKLILDMPKSHLTPFAKVATTEQSEYKTELRQVLDINFTYEEKLTIKTAFLYAEKEGLRVPEENSSNQEILELLERAYENSTFPYELSGKIQKILKKYL